MNKLTLYLNIFITVLMLAVAHGASAFDTSVYAERSQLSQGRWIKIGVERDGLYMITPSQLRQWGFSDISRVRVYGYGGRRQSDALSLDTYIDDLPQVQTVTTDAGLVFFGIGVGEWMQRSSRVWSYQQSDYDTAGYYFVTEVADASEAPRQLGTSGTPGGENPVTEYVARVHYELERTPVPGEAGPLLLGEDFRYTSSRTFTLSTPDMVKGEGKFHVSFVSNYRSSAPTIQFRVNGNAVPANNTDRLSVTSASHYVHGAENQTSHSFATDASNSSTTELSITVPSSASCTGAWLNYISLNYPRRLRIPADGSLVFDLGGISAELDGAVDGTVILDVTDPQNVARVDADVRNGKARWISAGGYRRYAAFTPKASLPTLKGQPVANQNLHADSDYDMVIVAPSAFISDAGRLAALHTEAPDNLSVKVVTPEDIYNEFSSGTVSPGAIRRYFKMLYDRGNAGLGRPLRYAILMARTTIDNRGLSISAPTYPVIPSWMPTEHRTSLSDNEGFCTDDVTAMLEDGSGSSLRNDKLSIAIGRIPVTSVLEARQIVDKAIQYAEGSRKTAWKHRFMFLADDQDNSVHMLQTENMISKFVNADRQQHLVRKVYMDAYPLVGSTYPQARADMMRYLDEGVVWWNFVGHANTTGWTADGQLSYSDLNSMYLRHWPFIYAATCDFLRLDGSNITGGEILYKERYGGAIGIISAVRPVYISDNGMLSNAMGRALALRDENGRFLPPGEIYRLAKNDIRDKYDKPVSDENRLRYTFIGDPALRLAMPSNIVRLDRVGGVEVEGDNQPTMAALSQVPVEGTVTAPDGTPLEDFNGIVLVEIFDAERSRTTLGTRDESTQEPFEDYGERIYCGSTEVRNGHFTLTVAMPSEISQNFRPAAMSLYAYSTTDDTEAVGLCRGFYVYGYDETAPADDAAPRIESMVLNHSSFTSGANVNASPMLIAEVSDNVGINLSTAGVGHQMTVSLDGRKSYNDVSGFFTPAADGSPSGVINYPLEGLQPGPHTLALRVWDTSGNSAVREIDFNVVQDLAPKIYDVYTDANPASTTANFYLSHDQPDRMASVVVTVYNLLGQPVWSGSAKGRSEMFRTVPVSWDLTDSSGRRVPRGIYLYRASVSCDDSEYETSSRKIAVTAQ